MKCNFITNIREPYVKLYISYFIFYQLRVLYIISILLICAIMDIIYFIYIDLF